MTWDPGSAGTPSLLRGGKTVRVLDLIGGWAAKQWVQPEKSIYGGGGLGSGKASLGGETQVRATWRPQEDLLWLGRVLNRTGSEKARPARAVPI